MAKRLTPRERAQRRLAKARAKLEEAEAERQAATQFAFAEGGMSAQEIADAWGWKSRQTTYNYVVRAGEEAEPAGATS